MGRAERALERALATRTAPLVAGLVTALLVSLFWGGLDMPGIVHDERSYLVQARLLAQGMWTAPSPPLPEFWEMAHVFVEPALFSKYPPGHAPLLVPGIWLGVQGLMPVLLAGLSAALVFSIARTLFGGAVALLGWGIWTASPEVLRWHGSYFSQATTTPLWLLAIVCLIAWQRRERPWHLAAIVACVGWIGITRPATGFALGLPILVAVLWTSWTRRSLVGWGRAAIVGALVVAIVPLWANTTLGAPTTLPYIEYSKRYFPFDLPGFTRDTSPPTRTLPPDLEQLGGSLQMLYSQHTGDRVPEEFVRRARESLRHALGAVTPLLPLVLVGAVLGGAAVGGFGVASFVLLIVSHLVMPQPPGWTIYSLETFAVAPVLLALAIVRGGSLLRERLRPNAGAAPAAVAAAGLAIFFGLVQLDGIGTLRELQAVRSERALVLEARLDALPADRVVIFIHRPRPMAAHRTLWDILGPPATTDRWIVRDLGDERNAALIALSDGRVPYRLDERTMRLERLSVE